MSEVRVCGGPLLSLCCNDCVHVVKLTYDAKASDNRLQDTSPCVPYIRAARPAYRRCLCDNYTVYVRSTVVVGLFGSRVESEGTETLMSDPLALLEHQIDVGDR